MDFNELLKKSAHAIAQGTAAPGTKQTQAKAIWLQHEIEKHKKYVEAQGVKNKVTHIQGAEIHLIKYKTAIAKHLETQINGTSIKKVAKKAK